MEENEKPAAPESGGKPEKPLFKSVLLHEKPRNPRSNDILPYVLCLTLIAAICVIIFSTLTFTQFIEVMAARRRYAPLQEMADGLAVELASEPAPAQESAAPAEEPAETPYISPFDAEMRAVNPDYICWIRIEDTMINYPVVRAEDNEKYLDISFSGVKSSLGTLFLDYRCAGEYAPHLIIYGHNTRNGDMFGRLRLFLDERYMAEHPVITLMVNGRIVEYEIFSAKRTDINDPAYFIDFTEPGAFAAFLGRIGAPKDAAQIITLSTCVSGNDDDERVVVHGAYLPE